MRFNSVRSSDYSQSAKAVNRSANQAFDAAMASSPDFTKISTEAIKGRSMERRSAQKAEAAVAKAGIQAFTKNKIVKERADRAKDVADIKRPAQRMAGVVAGLGSIAGAAVLHKENKIAKQEREELKAERLATEKLQADFMKDSAARDERIEKMYQTILNRDNNSGSSDTTNQETDTPLTADTSTSTQSSTSASSFKLLPHQARGLSEIRRVESGPYGYDAYNLGGKTEFEPIGSGSAADGKRFGKPLTQMTIGEIKQLGASGKIHATGAYQFIHSSGSFGEAAQFAGLNDNDVFSPENQDRMALAFGQKYGWKPWSGLKLDSQARDAAIAGFK